MPPQDMPPLQTLDVITSLKLSDSSVGEFPIEKGLDGGKLLESLTIVNGTQYQYSLLSQSNWGLILNPLII